MQNNSPHPASNPVFHICIRTEGNLLSSYVFQNEAEVKHWEATQLPILEKTHGPLTLRKSALDGLRVGDACWVYGEGDTEFVITNVICRGPCRYSFALNAGWPEDVTKCYRPPRT